MTTQDAKKIDLIGYFSSLGIELQKTTKTNKWYCSPFREEKTASLKVEGNVWYDFGTGEGGTIIDFGVKYFNCTISDFLKHLAEKSDITKTDFSSFQQQPPTLVNKNEVQCSLSTTGKIKILTIKELTHSLLLEYLADRGIDEITAKTYCKQIEYLNGSKKFYSIGFENASGGFELRSKGFKSCTSPKDVSFIDNGFDKLAIFEGFTDFLSYQMLADLNIQKSNWLILNSLSFLNKITATLLRHRQLFLFLDNDAAGRSAVSKIAKLQLSQVDMSLTYADHKDVNEYLLWTIKKC